MQRYEYKVVPAPRKGLKTRSARTAEDRFAAALEEVMNAQGAQGWEYVRSDTLPAEERQGLTGRTTVYQNMLVFRRTLDTAAQPGPVLTATPAVPVPVAGPLAVSAPVAGPVPGQVAGPVAGSSAPGPVAAPVSASLPGPISAPVQAPFPAGEPAAPVRPVAAPMTPPAPVAAQPAPLSFTAGPAPFPAAPAAAGRDPFSVPAQAPLVLHDPDTRPAPALGPAVPRDIG